MSHFDQRHQSLLDSHNRLYPSLESRSYSSYHNEPEGEHAVADISSVELPSSSGAAAKQESVVIRVAAKSSSSSADGETGVGTPSPYVAETVPLEKTCCRTTYYLLLIATTVCFVPMVSWILILVLLNDVRDELAGDIRTLMVEQFVNNWMATVVEPSLRATAELQMELARSHPQLYSNSLSMSQLQTDNGWLSSFSNVAARYPQFSSFGLQSANRFNSSANQIFIQYAKNMNSTTPPFQVRLSTDNNQQQVYYPTPSSPSGINQLYPADISLYDTPATIAKYLGQPTAVATNFDVRNTPEYAFASKLNNASTPSTSFDWMGIANDQGQPHGSGLNFVATAPAVYAPPGTPTSPSALWFTQISTNTLALYNLLAVLPNINSRGGAYICSTTGWILASTTGYSDYDLHGSSNQYLQLMGDFLSGAGLLQSEHTWSGPFSAGQMFTGSQHVGGKGGVTYQFTATILPTISAYTPADSYIPTAPQLILYFVTVNDRFVDGANYNGMLISSSLLAPLGYVLLVMLFMLLSFPFSRVMRTVQAVVDFYTNPSGLTASENLRTTLLAAVKGWSKESRTGRAVPPRTAQVIKAYLPAENPEPGKKRGTLEFPIIVHACWYRRFGEIIVLNDFVERYLYTLAEAQTIKCYPTEDAFNFASGLRNQ